jgi:8-oxo-dGTP pyrophosphatase MutT (NUDIX family)
MDKPKIGAREVVYQNPYMRVYRVPVQFADFDKVFYVSDYGPRAGVLLVKEGNVLLVRQYRLLIDALAWEIPGGKVDANETLEEAAARECLEETGLRCRRLERLLYFHPGLDTCDNPTHVFYCADFEQSPSHQPDRQEVSELVWVPFSRCLEMVFAGEIVDSLSVNAILAYQVKQGSNHV